MKPRTLLSVASLAALLIGSAWVWLTARPAGLSESMHRRSVDFGRGEYQASSRAVCDECGRQYAHVADVRVDWRCHDCSSPVVLEKRL